jgi:Holliday junction resolvase RusA-like endonuclease
VVAAVPASEIRVVIPGDPCAQGRARIAVVAGHARAYDPAKSRSWKGAAGVWMREAAGPGVPFPLMPVTLTVDAYFRRPKLAKKVGAERLPRASRPDADNLGKSVMDAGNGILWTDDAQIVSLTVRKWYAAQGESPRVEIVVQLVEVPHVG